MLDGSPQITPTWVDIDDGTIPVNTAEGRLKTKKYFWGTEWQSQSKSGTVSTIPSKPVRNGSRQRESDRANKEWSR